MAHQFPREVDPQNEESDEQGQQQQQESATRDFAPHQRLHSGPIRSSPIAIRRNSTESGRSFDTSEDDDDEGDDFVERDAIMLGNATQSLPTRLLRAPFLGSVPTNEDNISYHNMLPPSCVNSEQSDTTTSYGSLRDSHVRGRFLDGPCSYRDQRTGNIRPIQHRVRFRDNTMTATDQSMLSIGERIQQSTRQQQQREQESKERTSSLAAMLEGTDETTENDVEQQVATVASIPFYNEHDTVSRLPPNMLSTSLTGLEVLQRGLQRPSEQQQQGGNVVDFELDELPRDASGSNALLSRSLSDPTPQLRRLSVENQSSSRSPQQQQQQQAASRSPFLLSPAMQPLPPSEGVGNLSGVYHASFQQQQQQQQQQAEEPSDHNPDTEGAFGMDDLEL